MKTISAAEANRQFSRILREVGAGETVIVTSRGRPVAQIVPVPLSTMDRKEAWASLWTRLDSQAALNLGRFDRGEFYDD